MVASESAAWRSIILNNTKIGKNCLIGANTLIAENKNIPDNSMVSCQISSRHTSALRFYPTATAMMMMMMMMILHRGNTHCFSQDSQHHHLHFMLTLTSCSQKLNRYAPCPSPRL